MEFETISDVNSGYSASEITRTASKKTTGENVNISAPNSALNVAQVAEVNAKDNAGQQGGNSQQQEHMASEASINDAVSKANHRMEHTRCEYSYHKETNRVSIKVLNADTDEVIREIPPEKSLDMLQKMWEMAGILVDERR
ncbi:MAG: flagellar protein FlaG [Clostridiales bacterium]|nr:flagellar protein FlaG [Clostridiales bacterium]